MCGLLGAIGTRNDSFMVSSFSSGLEAIAHRGPDDAALSCLQFSANGELELKDHGRHLIRDARDVSAAAVVGHRRLSIQDLSESGVQPMWSRDHMVCIDFNGEVYNFIELRAELASLGYEFHTGTDTEVVMTAYIEWGKSCFERFNGMWAIAILDLRLQELVLSRDRFGIKPLYVAVSQENVAFCSELKGLINANLISPTVDRRVVHEFLVYNQHPVAGKSFLENVESVRPGSIHRYSLRSLDCVEDSLWWKVNPVEVDPGDELEMWRELFLDAVKIRMRSDVPVGSSLSGGLDSSAIVAAVHHLFPNQKRFNTFTSCYRNRSHDEREFAESVVRYIGARPHWVYPGEQTNLMDDLDGLVAAQDEPFSTLSLYSQYSVMRIAKQAGVKVLLDGQGADELLLGYDNSLAVQVASSLRLGKLSTAASQFANLIKNREGLGLKRLLGLVAYTGVPTLSRWRNNQRVAPYLGEIYKRGWENVSDVRPFPSSLMTARKGWLEDHPLPALLRYEDRNSMAFSIETRLPFLDFRLVNLAFGLSGAAISRDGWTKYAVRDAIKSIAPPEVVWRKNKMGFPSPTEQFIENNRDLFASLFDESARSAGLLSPKVVAQGLRKARIEKWHWRLISLELWMRRFNVSAGC